MLTPLLRAQLALPLIALLALAGCDVAVPLVSDTAPTANVIEKIDGPSELNIWCVGGYSFDPAGDYGPGSFYISSGPGTIITQNNTGATKTASVQRTASSGTISLKWSDGTDRASTTIGVGGIHCG